MSQSPTQGDNPENEYLDAWRQLALRIQQGASFSGRERNCCFLNTGGTRFADASAALGLDHIDDGRTLALTDWDHDGDVDVWLANRTGPRVRFMRNDVPSENHFVALRLEGDPSQGTNRDAIGARVRLAIREGDSVKVLSQTVAAGDSYLSQSSKWLTFGLGKAARIQRAAVRWPGSREFVAIQLPQVDTRYQVRQSTAEALPVTVTRTLRLTASAAKSPVTSGKSRLRFSQPPLVQELTYQNLAKDNIARQMPLDGPLLLTLWSSTCAPCLAEFSELGEFAETWKRSGLELLALNVEALGGQTAPDANDLQTLLASTGFPGQIGFATDELIEQLDQLQRQSVYRQRPLPVPTSFLLDHGGWLRVVYRGVVSVDQLRQDLENLRTTEERGLALSIPFPGRWGRDEFVSHPVAVAKVQLEDGYPAEARAYLRKYLDDHPPPAANQQDLESTQARRRLADVYYQLSIVARRQRQPTEALAYLQESLKLHPASVPGLVDMADAMSQRGDLTRADRMLSRALKVAPQDSLVHTRIGELRMRQGRAAAAIPHFELAIRSRRWLPAANNLAWIRATHPDSSLRRGSEAVELARRVCKQTNYSQPTALDTLAAALAESREFKEAAPLAERASQLAQTDGNAKLSQEIAKRAKLYLAGQAYVDTSLQK